MQASFESFMFVIRYLS